MMLALVLSRIATGTYADVASRDGLQPVVHIAERIPLRGGHGASSLARHPRTVATLDAR
jgi:hypothetical protein